ncbi:hypothetical protein Nepgr_024036 [Nepenthes gracilis]|uniref:Uncharacterized protein n=1 Tax=Nepenthes gracilis TaxID=150966 RepID=A0AAD3T3A9_NEPGR|nr:hypothetical protein Nepgr_024036 [Nepenthes gracilis]
MGHLLGVRLLCRACRYAVLMLLPAAIRGLLPDGLMKSFLLGRQQMGGAGVGVVPSAFGVLIAFSSAFDPDPYLDEGLADGWCWNEAAEAGIFSCYCGAELLADSLQGWDLATFWAEEDPQASSIDQGLVIHTLLIKWPRASLQKHSYAEASKGTPQNVAGIPSCHCSQQTAQIQQPLLSAISKYTYKCSELEHSQSTNSPAPQRQLNIPAPATSFQHQLSARAWQRPFITAAQYMEPEKNISNRCYASVRKALGVTSLFFVGVTAVIHAEVGSIDQVLSLSSSRFGHPDPLADVDNSVASQLDAGYRQLGTLPFRLWSEGMVLWWNGLADVANEAWLLAGGFQPVWHKLPIFYGPTPSKWRNPYNEVVGQGSVWGLDQPWSGPGPQSIANTLKGT